ncbi:MAG: catalase HPII, partial [Gemmatimonadota bacterium]|nr:catalase HPII [Gemmatimonadota bacterium]
VWDAVVLLDGDGAQQKLALMGQALEFLKDQYRHCKPILAYGSSATLLERADISLTLPNGSADPGIIADSGTGKSNADGNQRMLTAFVEALAAHRHFEREMDPPMV